MIANLDLAERARSELAQSLAGVPWFVRASVMCAPDGYRIQAVVSRAALRSAAVRLPTTILGLRVVVEGA